jgi:demethylmenaquinone methyltransferase/2-methoxy-6-polyprenyl-1,4-benzoquinol methylase
MAEKWDTICHHDKNKNNEMLDLVNIKQGSKVLDVGTGTGVMIPFLTSRIGDTGEIVAVDVVEKMIEVARSKYNDSNGNPAAKQMLSCICCEVLESGLLFGSVDYYFYIA